MIAWIPVRTKAVRPMPKAEQPEKPAATTVAEETRIPEETLIPETDDIGPEDTPEEPATDNRPVVQDSSPFVPQPSTEKSAVQLNIGTGGAIAAGGGLLAALATQLARADLRPLLPRDHAPTIPTALTSSTAWRQPIRIECLWWSAFLSNSPSRRRSA